MAITSPSADQKGGHVLVTWDWVTGVSPSACTYDLQRCGSENFSPADSIEVLASATVSSSYDDADITSRDLWRKMFYRVITHVSGGADYISDVVTYTDGYVDRVLQEIRWRMNIGLTRGFGTPALVFIKKTAGQRCHECWDPILKRTTRDHCPVCLGQGFEGGFYAPISSWMRIAPTQNAPSIDAQGLDQRNVTQADMPYTPYITHGDVIMDMSNNLYIVIANQSTTKAGAIGHQTIQMRLLNRDAVEYRLIQDLMDLAITRENNVPLIR